jgi:hypothetical protein
MISTFDSNLLDPAVDPLTVVHERTRGYLVQPLDQFLSPSGQRMAPWPLNRNLPPAEFRFYTYRDTALTAEGGANSNGADPASISSCPESIAFQKSLGGTQPSWINSASHYGDGEVPSIGLPLLIDFRTYPDSNAQGLNLLRYRYCTNALLGNSLASPLPVARLHSTGAQLPNGSIVQVNPDQQTSATGSFDQAGLATPGPDAGLYLGQADFVVRVNRMHTIWLDSGAPSSWEPALFLPGVLDQPSGTQVSVAYRGAINITASGNADLNNAGIYNPYGNVENAPAGAALGVTFLNSDASWKDDISLLDGSRYLQMRLTMVSNVERDVEPAITALGVSFSN